MQLEADQHRQLAEFAHKRGWLAPDITINKLTPAGEGNMNRVLRAELSDGGSLIFKQSLPYVAKYPEISAPIERLQVEAHFYSAITRHAEVGQRMPRVVGYDRKTWLLCMEDLGPSADCTYLYQREATSDAVAQVVTPLLGWLSRLHHVRLNTEQIPCFANPAMRRLNHEHLFEVPFLANNGVALSPALGQFAAQLAQDQAVQKVVARLGRIYLGQEDHHTSNCLLHGDFYPGSWMRHTALEAMVIDPEFSFYGPAEIDIGVTLAHLHFTGLTPAECGALLEHYQPTNPFSQTLAQQFAGIELIRRLLGVAQLPLVADEATKLTWLGIGRQYLLQQ